MLTKAVYVRKDLCFVVEQLHIQAAKSSETVTKRLCGWGSECDGFERETERIMKEEAEYATKVYMKADSCSGKL